MDYNGFIADLSQKTGWKKELCRRYSDFLIKELTSLIGNGVSVTIPKLGVFEEKKIAEKVLLDVKSGEKYLVAPRIEMNFSPSQELIERIKGSINDIE